jgi:hypothetical protein
MNNTLYFKNTIPNDGRYRPRLECVRIEGTTPTNYPTIGSVADARDFEVMVSNGCTIIIEPHEKDAHE